MDSIILRHLLNSAQAVFALEIQLGNSSDLKDPSSLWRQWLCLNDVKDVRSGRRLLKDVSNEKLQRVVGSDRALGLILELNRKYRKRGDKVAHPQYIKDPTAFNAAISRTADEEDRQDLRLILDCIV